MRSFYFVLVAVLVAVAGCGPKENAPADAGPPAGYAGSKDGPPGGKPSKLSMDSLKQIQIGVFAYNDAKQLFGGDGERTNDEKPGLGAGSKWVWKEDAKKVYVSFGMDGKATGVAWEGFGGK